MTFEKEEELFPTVDDVIGKENVTVSSEVAEPVPDAKRKSPEKPADKKVGFFVYSRPWSLLQLSMFSLPTCNNYYCGYKHTTNMFWHIPF